MPSIFIISLETFHIRKCKGAKRQDIYHVTTPTSLINSYVWLKIEFNSNFMIVISSMLYLFPWKLEENRNNFNSPLPYCIHYLSVAVIKYPEQSNLKKKAFLHTYILHGSRSTNIADHTQHIETENRKQGEPVKIHAQ